jgi:hypothetical protein
MFRPQVAKAIAELREAAARSAWTQWAAIFTFPVTKRRATAIVDPEALLLGSFALSEYERRLRSVIALWGLHHSRLLSVQRAKNLSERFPEPVQDALGAFAHLALARGGDLRWRSVAQHVPKVASVREREKEASPVLEGGAAVMLRLRLGLGVGIKPDVIAYLIGLAGGRATVQAIAEATAYHGRAVRRGLEELAAAGFVEPRPTAPVSYRVDSRRWSALLRIDPEDPPAWRAWAAMYAFVAALDEWGRSLPESEFVLASEARDLLLKYGVALEGTVRLPYIEGAMGEALLPLFTKALAACREWVEGVV